jgi:hypothetical protein
MALVDMLTLVSGVRSRKLGEAVLLADSLKTKQ